MKIQVTKTFLPPQKEYGEILKRAWDKDWITNRGELVVELEEKLCSYLGVKQLTVTANGTLPIQLAISALELSGEVITTPFSYVATTASLVWQACTPVFVDIDPEYLTIDENKIEAAITSKTSAILATHVFGNPCHIEKIQEIADRHNLKVIYDAAHCFGVNYKGQSMFNYGDVSTCSFHGTKLFQTGEGGCFVAPNLEVHEKLYFQHKFGHDGPEVFRSIGINAKMSELSAAMGLAMLNYVDGIIENRLQMVKNYDHMLQGSDLERLKIREGTIWNGHYYPVITKNEESLLSMIKALNDENIFPRRYFYPSLNTLPYVEHEPMEVSESISRRIMCLPMFHDLTKEQQQKISDIILSVK